MVTGNSFISIAFIGQNYKKSGSYGWICSSGVQLIKFTSYFDCHFLMTKICGYYLTGDRHAYPGLLRTMTHSMAGAEWHKPVQFELGQAGLGHVSNGVFTEHSWPLWDNRNENGIVFSGVLYDHQRVLENLGLRKSDLEGLPGDAGFLLEIYKLPGNRIFHHLNGLFSGAIINIISGKLVVFNDRYGLRPLYYYRDDNRFLFASEVKAILGEPAIPRQINWKAWSDFFNLGWVAGDDTFFEGIRAVPPATVVECTDGNFSRSAYWDYCDIKVDHSLTEKDAVAGASEMLRKTMDKLIAKAKGKQVIIPLSGGNDSRMIAASAKEKGLEFRSLTTRKDSEVITDKVLAEKLKDALGIPWEYIDLGPDLYPRFFLKTLFQTEFMTPEHLWSQFMIEKIPFPAVILDGFAGGNIMGMVRHYDPVESAMLSDRKNQDFNWFLEKMIRKPGAVQISNIFREEFQSVLNHSCLHNLKASFQDFPPEPLSISSFMVSNRSRRAVTPYMFNMMSVKADVFCPFLEDEFYSFIQSIPPEMKTNNSFYELWRKEMFPDLAGLPTLKSMAPVKYTSKEAYTSFRNSNVINFLMEYLKKYPPPGDIVDHRKAMEYLFYATRKPGNQDHFHRTIFLRNYLVFLIWYNTYFESGSLKRSINRLRTVSTLPLLKLKHLL